MLTPLPQSAPPRVVTFQLNRIIVEVPEKPNLFCVTFEGPHPARCSCQKFKQHRTCTHTALASAHLFSDEGMMESLDLIAPQVCAPSMPDSNDPAIYGWRALVAIQTELMGRLGLFESTHEEFDVQSATYHYPAWPRQLTAKEIAANQEYVEWEDCSDPFAPNALTVRPVSYYMAGLAL